MPPAFFFSIATPRPARRASPGCCRCGLMDRRAQPTFGFPELEADSDMFDLLCAISEEQGHALEPQLPEWDPTIDAEAGRYRASAAPHALAGRSRRDRHG